MQCEGYKRAPHNEPIYAKGLCQVCYMRKYQAEHLTELQEYQKEYRADPAYTKVARLYMRDYRKRG